MYRFVFQEDVQLNLGLHHLAYCVETTPNTNVHRRVQSAATEALPSKRVPFEKRFAVPILREVLDASQARVRQTTPIG